MKKKKSIHFVGIKGVGMTPLAIIAKEAGFNISGCDIDEAFITDECLLKNNIKPLIGFSKEHLKNVDLVITTGAHGGIDNEEVVFALKNGIKVLTQGEALGLFMGGDFFGKKFLGISVAGSHGKTTTTAILATIFKKAGLKPSYAIGTSIIPSLGCGGHYDHGKYFIAEADEYATEPQYNKLPKFLWQHPKIAIFTNIELDHPDIYPSEESLVAVFSRFTNNLVKDGLLIVCGDDSNLRRVVDQYRGRVVSYGFSVNNDYFIKKVSVLGNQTFFWLENKQMTLGEFTLCIPGEHNALNATGAIIASLECGLSIEVIKKSLPAYSGSKRRSEYKGQNAEGVLFYDDYAHHPTEIKKTLRTFKQVYPKKKIVAIFQPHTYSRTKTLFEQFISSFTDADVVLLTDIYASLREKTDSSITSENLAQSISKLHKDAIYLPSLANVVQYLSPKKYNKDTVIITLGAGDIYKIYDYLQLA